MTTQLLSPAEEDTIKAELEGALNSLIAGCEALDMEQAFRIFSDSPEFLMMGTDGSLCGYQAYVKGNVDYLLTCSRFELTTLKREIRVLSRELAVLAWAYHAEATLNTGERDIFENAGASFVFRKLGDEWKVVYYHESSTPPRHEKEEIR